MLGEEEEEEIGYKKELVVLVVVKIEWAAMAAATMMN